MPLEELINDHRGQIICRLDMKSHLGNDFRMFRHVSDIYVLEEKQAIAIQKL